MRPSIQDGERVLVAPASPATLRAGDIVAYARDDGLRAHRLLARRGGRGGRCVLLVAADAGVDPPETVDEADVVGRVVAVERDGRIQRLDGRARRLLALARAARRRLAG
jgi:SOS-response transcriptional repressor LexA